MKYVCLLLLFAAPAWGQKVTLPPEVKVQPGRLAAVTVEWEGDDLKYVTPPELDVFREFDPDVKKVRLRLIGYAAGKYTIVAVAAKSDPLVANKARLSEFATCIVVVGTPAPPVPPDPPVKVSVPNLVGHDWATAMTAVTLLNLRLAQLEDTSGTVKSQQPPAGTSVSAGSTIVVTMSTTPPVDPAPIPLPGLRVMIVEESKERDRLLPGQQAAILGKQVRDYLNAKCVKEGMQPAYWIIDKDVPVDGLEKHWRDVFARPRKSLPWLIVSNGKTGYEGELPKNLDETMAILKKHGGE